MFPHSHLSTLAVLCLLPVLLAGCGEPADRVTPSEDPPAPAETPTPGPAPDEPVFEAAKGAIGQADAFIAEQKIDKTKSGWKTKLPKPPKFTFGEDETYYWVLATNQGTMKFRLLTDVAPMHASSTIYLTRLGFYDDLGFHRVIERFMAQGGCPLGNGRGGPGYKYGGEFSRSVRHDRGGLLSMANAGPNTDGSQFFITFVPYPSLDDKHTIFGELVEGESVLRRFEELAPPRGSRRIAPTEPIEIVEATIEVE